MGTLSVPTEHGLTTFWVSLRAALSHTRFPPTHRSSLYRSSLVGTVICARQLFGDNTVLQHYESHTVNLTYTVHSITPRGTHNRTIYNTCQWYGNKHCTAVWAYRAALTYLTVALILGLL